MERFKHLDDNKLLALCLYRETKDNLKDKREMAMILMEKAAMHPLGVYGLILQPHDSHYSISGNDFCEIFEFAGDFSKALTKNRTLCSCYEEIRKICLATPSMERKENGN